MYVRVCVCLFFYLRYLEYGSVTAKAAALMATPEVENFLSRLIMRVAPKSYAQAMGEVVVTRRFLENFSGEHENDSESLIILVARTAATVTIVLLFTVSAGNSPPPTLSPQSFNVAVFDFCL